MKIKFTNKNNVTFPLACFLAHTDYDLISKPNVISVTSLLKPIRQIILQEQYPNLTTEIDLMGMAPSTMGSAMHMWLEIALNSPETRNKALAALGMENLQNTLVCNPDPTEEPDKENITIYTEKRETKEIDNITISGKFDLVLGNQIYDLKTSSVWGKIFNSNIEKYRQQLSIYRWLNPKLIKNPEGIILYWFTDWSASAAKQKKDYPQLRCESEGLTLMTLNQTEEFIREKLNGIKEFKDKPQSELPLCSTEELWQTQTKYKFYKNPNAKRATKVFNTAGDAYARQAKDGGIVREVQGEAKACKWCPVVTICEQAKALENQGLLIFE
jgi:hypothetical protein